MAEPTTVQDRWTQGDLYEPYIGRWSRQVAREFIPWLGVGRNKRWLDVGSGTGALTQTILDIAEPASVLGIDRSEGFTAYARDHVPDPRANFKVGDAQDLKVDRASFDVVVSGLVLNFVQNPMRMATEMCRAAQLYGRVALYLWDYAEAMHMLRHYWDAVVELDPAAKELDEGPRFPLANAKALWNLFLDAGLQDVTTTGIVIPMHFENFDALWQPFQGGQGPAPAYLKSLSQEKRDALRDNYRKRLPTNADGSIDLSARAWAVKGTR